MSTYTGRHCRTEAGWTDSGDHRYQGRHRATRATDLIGLLRDALGDNVYSFGPRDAALPDITAGLAAQDAYYRGHDRTILARD